jgi:hypothetical protein
VRNKSIEASINERGWPVYGANSLMMLHEKLFKPKNASLHEKNARK